MDIGSYTFEEFAQLAAEFHGYAAPGLLIGGYMVEMAKKALPQGTLFEAVVESSKCLPDAVQLLTLCSTGNQRLKIINLGRYAVTLFDKYTGEGARVSLDVEKMRAWPELYAWFMKLKAKKDQDSDLLEKEISEAGDTICKLEKVRIQARFVGGKHMGKIGVCPICGEAYPAADGGVCRGCQGEAPYVSVEGPCMDAPAGGVRIVPVEEAVGKVAAHDMTRIEPGSFKGPQFRAGQRIEAGDICSLQRMGRFNVAIADEMATTDAIHENEAALAFAKKMAGKGISYDKNPHEGKIDFKAAIDGLFCVNREALTRFNLVPQVMAASRHDASLIKSGTAVAGTRAIPLFLPRPYFNAALNVLEDGPLFEVLPLRKARVGILVTGTEVFKGLIEDKFIPIISSKITDLGSEITRTAIVPDDKTQIGNAIKDFMRSGVDLLITTGGLSVDPDDVTRQALLESGLEDIVHGMPVLPGAMSLTGKLRDSGTQVIGVPACALYYRTTFLDLVLPRLLANREFTRAEASGMAEGGYCMSCKICSWPKCPFGK